MTGCRAPSRGSAKLPTVRDACDQPLRGPSAPSPSKAPTAHAVADIERFLDADFSPASRVRFVMKQQLTKGCGSDASENGLPITHSGRFSVRRFLFQPFDRGRGLWPWNVMVRRTADDGLKARAGARGSDVRIGRAVVAGDGRRGIGRRVRPARQNCAIESTMSRVAIRRRCVRFGRRLSELSHLRPSRSSDHQQHSHHQRATGRARRRDGKDQGHIIAQFLPTPVLQSDMRLTSYDCRRTPPRQRSRSSVR